MSHPARRSLERLESRHLLAADASLSGTVWFDANQDAVWDLDEVGLPAIQVYLDLNGDGQLNVEEPATFTLSDDPSTTEDESGYYEFTNLEPGEYEIRVVLADELEQTFPHAIPEMEDLMVNGSFEEGYQGWVNITGADGRRWLDPATSGFGASCLVGDGFEELYGGVTPQDGERVALNRFNAVSVPNLYQLYQDVDLTTVPTSALLFLYRVEWNHACDTINNSPMTIPSTFSIEVRDAATNQILQEIELAALTAAEPIGDTTWQQFSLSLDEFSGRAVRVAFVADVQSVNVQYSRIQLDAVQVLAPTSTEVIGSHTVVLGPGEAQGSLDFGIYSLQPPNLAPVLSGPEEIALDEDQSLPLNGLLHVSDADAADQDLQLTISVDVGELTLSDIDGITVISGSAAGDSQLILQGSQAALNAALDSLTFDPPEHFHGGVVLELIASDMGNTGLGGEMYGKLTVPLQVAPQNDPPQVNLPLDTVLVQEGTLTQTVDVSQLFTDIDIATSGDLLSLAVTANTNEALVIPSWVEGDLVLALAPGLSGQAVLTLTATDQHGASVEFLLNVNVLATSRISLNLKRASEFAEIGQPDSNGGGPAAIFHEWEDAAAELWITIQSDLPDGPLDLAWTAESTVPWIHQAELIEHMGTASSVTATAQENGTRFTGLLEGVDLTGFDIGDRVLLATLHLPKNDEDLVGVPHNLEGAYAEPTSESGLTLTEARLVAADQSLAVDETVPGHFMPVIFDADDNGGVGLSDFAHFVASFGLEADQQNPKAFRFDYNRSGKVGLDDFVTFVRFFGARKGSDHAIAIADLLGQEAAQPALAIEGEPVSDRVAVAEMAPLVGGEASLTYRFTEPEERGAVDEPAEAILLAASDRPTLATYDSSLDPAILDALWRADAWEDEVIDDFVLADESLEPELSDWSEF